LEIAKKKWARKMERAGPRWKKGVTDKSSEYAKRMAEFLGIPSISGEKVEAYRSGVGAVTAEDFASAVRGKETKWAEKLREAFA
jgi:hypothetical protein